MAPTETSSTKTAIIIAVITVLGTIIVACISNIDKLTRSTSSVANSIDKKNVTPEFIKEVTTKPIEEVSTKAITEIQIESIKKIITNYYETLSNRDYATLSSFYTSNIDRYYTDFNITPEDAIKNASDYWDKFKITSAQTKINWNSFNVGSLSNGCYNVAYNMEYSIERLENTKAKRFNLNIVVLLSPELKIRSIYENIISARK